MKYFCEAVMKICFKPTQEYVVPFFASKVKADGKTGVRVGEMISLSS
jgi:hypothetical protein